MKSSRLPLSLWTSRFRQMSFFIPTDVIPKKNNPDVFGTLGKEKAMNAINRLPEEEGDVKVVDFLDGIEGKTKLKPEHYAAIIKGHLKSKDLVAAIDVLEKRMLVDEKAKPDKYIFNLLISGCGKVGYAKKAFQLYNQMKKRGIRVSGGTYTSLFNACANSPFSKDGLEKASHLKELMSEKGWEMNEVNAHAMIKAFGRCGDITQAFSVVDSMKTKGLPISAVTINFLLQACASDQEDGYRHALVVWRKLIDMKLKPNIYTYNLMLRCARDCKIGDSELLLEDLKKLLPPNSEDFLLTKEQLNVKLTTGQSDEKKSRNSKWSLVPKTENSLLIINDSSINFLDIKPTISTTVILDKVKKGWHRLALLGGSKGFLDTMDKSQVNPDIKTFTQLLDVIPAIREAEQYLIAEMKQRNIPIDVDFCNMLIKKRCRENQFQAAREVIEMISKEGLKPNIVTFGVLALACRNATEVKHLIRDLRNVGYRLNIEILGTLIHNACVAWNIPLIIYLINILFNEQFKPNNKFLTHLNSFRYEVEEELKKSKVNGLRANTKFNDKEFLSNWETFLVILNKVNTLEVEDAQNVHPWHQFKKKNVSENDS